MPYNSSPMNSPICQNPATASVNTMTKNTANGRFILSLVYICSSIVSRKPIVEIENANAIDVRLSHQDKCSFRDCD